MIMKLDILYEDENIIVVHKPAGVAVENARATSMDIVAMVRNHFLPDSSYVGLVHRLDQPVEGIVVIGKNKAATAKLSKELQQHNFTKRYYALVTGEVPESGRLEDYIAKDAKTKMAVDATSDNGKKSALEYKVVEMPDGQEVDATCLDILLETGRFHQIRFQLSKRGWPILGDVKYGGENDSRFKRGAIALCAYELSFTHPVTGETMTYRIKPKWLP